MSRHIFICINLILMLTAMSSAKGRKVYLESELINSSMAEEVIIDGYDTMSTPSDSGMTISINFINFSLLRDTGVKLKKGIISISADLIANFNMKSTRNHIGQMNAFFPEVGDTVLIVLDSMGRVTLFAEIFKNEYKFWSPYSNTSASTIFYFKKPGRALAAGNEYERMIQNLKDPEDMLKSAWGCYYPKNAIRKLTRKRKCK